MLLCASGRLYLEFILDVNQTTSRQSSGWNIRRNVNGIIPDRNVVLVRGTFLQTGKLLSLLSTPLGSLVVYHLVKTTTTTSSATAEKQRVSLVVYHLVKTTTTTSSATAEKQRVGLVVNHLEKTTRSSATAEKQRVSLIVNDLEKHAASFTIVVAKLK